MLRERKPEEFHSLLQSELNLAQIILTSGIITQGFQMSISNSLPQAFGWHSEGARMKHT
jgi:hypothetical protein